MIYSVTRASFVAAAIAALFLFAAPFSASAMHPQSIGDDCDYVYGCDYNHGYIAPSSGGYDDYCDDYWYPCYDECDEWYGCDDYLYGYAQQASAYIPASYGYPTGDTDTFGSPLCIWPGYDGRASCDSNPRQPIYDPWTGRWY